MFVTHRSAPAAVTRAGAGKPGAAAIAYRPEIDGLRAFAVIPVLLFHANFSGFSGGFVGVDVFFVISGYLITGICLREIAAGRFSVWRFYERRARRILPALLVVGAACVPFGWAWMLPEQFENFGQSLFASVLSVNNILLFVTAGYWDLSAEFKPLLHTWSLGVEEQFYILFPPLLLLLFARARRSAFPVLLGVTALSLVVCQISIDAMPRAAFYLLHTRAWELLAGALCAFAGARRSTGFGAALGFLGLALVIVPVAIYDATTPFPSLYALAPVGGTVLVILFATGRNAAAAFLSFTPFMAVGWISYSLYLWHQPLFALARVRSLEEPTPPIYIGLIALAFVLSALSYRYVEQPFRDRRAMPLRAFVPVIAAAAAGLVAIGLVIHLTHGFPARGYAPDPDADPGGMYIDYNERVFGYAAPAFPHNGRENLLVVGTSVGRDFANMLLEAGVVEGRNLVYRTDVPRCVSRTGFEGYPAEIPALVAAADLIAFASVAFDQIACLQDDIAYLEGLGVRDVYIVGPKNFGYNLNPFMRVPVAERSDVRNRASDAALRLSRALKGAVPAGNFIDLVELLGGAEDGRVRVFDDAGRLLSADGIHLTRPGARFLGRRMLDGPLGALRVRPALDAGPGGR